MANITTQTIRVDLSTDKVIPSAFTHQNDTARTLVFDMYNGGMPYTMTGNTVKFAYKSPIVNGQYSVIAGASMASGTVSGNKVSVTLPVAYTQISGVGMLTMIITPTSGTVRPVNIRLVVQKSADGDDTVMGASDWPTGLYDYMDEWLAENEPTEIANIKSNLTSLVLDDIVPVSGTIERGSISLTTGEWSDSTNNYRYTANQPTTDNIKYTVNDGYRVAFIFYDSEGAFISSENWKTTSGTITAPSNATAFNIRAQTDPISTVSPSVIAENITVYNTGEATSINEKLVDYMYLHSTSLASGSSLDDVKDTGFYRMGYSSVYINNPFDYSCRKFLVVYKLSSAQSVQHMYDTDNGVYALRQYVDGTRWTAWSIININDITENTLELIQNTKNYSYVSYQNNNTQDNIGDQLKLVSYNIAQYNNDTTTMIPDNKLFNLKKAIMNMNADIIATQEDAQYIDADGTKLADEFVYKPIYPFTNGTGGPVIRAKKHASTGGVVQFTSGRSIRYSVFTINSKTVLIVNVHPTAGSDNTETRLQEYTELFNWLNGSITLSSINAPEHQYCIIAGDFNSHTDTDKTNLSNLAHTNNYTMANGDYLGWINTCMVHHTRTTPNALDNIIVSNNIIINKIISYESLFESLYSDHVPFYVEVNLI